MKDVLEILKYILPSAVVFATAYYLVKKMLDNEYSKKLLDLKNNNQKEVIPIKLQAYERIALFLERITPSSMMMRIPHSSLNVLQFQSSLLKTIRTEFEHNMSQQIYMSNQCWKAVTDAKETTIEPNLNNS